MNLDAVTAELRPRSPWEAVDFGARMIRRDAATIYKVWFATTLPLLLLATLGIIFLDSPGWVQFGYWWMEPLVDGPILYIISLRLFGTTTSARDALREVPRLAARNWIFLLTPLRFHFARSVAMPVVQLEQLAGKKRRARAKVLNSVTINHGIGVTAAYQHLALSIYLGIILLGFAFIPEGFHDTLGLKWFDQTFDSQDTAAYLLTLYIGYIAQSALHPWFVGAGFGLYINCRTMLEAWDVEVAFRRMLQRRASRIGTTAALLLAVVIAMPVDAGAEEMQPWWDDEAVTEAVENVYSDESLQTEETTESWRRIEQNDAEDDEDAVDGDTGAIMRFFRGIGKVASLIAEFGLWLLAALVIVALISTYKRWSPYLVREKRRRRKRRRVILATGEINADTIPDDVPAAVMQLWRSGNARDALGLLYRGSVFRAVERYGVRLPRSATEGACVSAVDEQTDQPHADFFSRVVAVWSWCAYGSRSPADEVITTLCAEWPSHYGASTSGR